jgi:Spy/CpxP family protein refolding chaperone
MNYHMISKVATFSLGAALLAPFLMAQGTGGPPDTQTMVKMRVSMLTSMLSLTDAQQTTATALFTDVETASATIRSNSKTNRQSLTAAIKKNDAASIESLAVAAGTISGQLTAIQSKAEAAFYAILTADQQTKYDSMPGGGFGGPGGPGGMGPGMGSAGSRGPRPD